MTRVKICGLYRFEDIGYVNEAKPDWCGFIINFPKSHRNVSVGQVRAMREKLSDGIIPVGVFVDQPVEFVAGLLNDGTVTVAQLHGSEDNTYIERLRKLAPGHGIWKAFKVRASEDLDEAEISKADMVLLDNGYGTGKAFDWKLAGKLKRPFILAGGLAPENINEAVEALHPYGVDVSSGVETGKIKDRQKIIAAIYAARKGE